MDQVEREIVGYVARAAAAEGLDAAVGPESGLLRSGLLDSLGLVGLIRFIEERFAVTIPDADLDPELFDTPRSVAGYVGRRLGQTAA